MKYYPDASVLIAAVTDEPGSSAARSWLADITPGMLVASRWCLAETASGLAIKVRTGAIDEQLRAESLASIARELEASAVTLSIIDNDFERAVAMIEICRTPLRGGDALHLAVAQRNNALIGTMDRRMAMAADALRISASLLS